jgi:hypothetical protein
MKKNLFYILAAIAIYFIGEALGIEWDDDEKESAGDKKAQLEEEIWKAKENIRMLEEELKKINDD